MGHRFDPRHADRLMAPERREALRPEALLDLLAIGPADDVADVGCGPGFFTLPAARRTRGTVYGIDIAPEMLEHLAENARSAGASNVRPVLSPAAPIPLPDHAVDRAIAAFVLHEVPDLSAALAEIRRLLRPGGRLLVVEWDARPMPVGPPLEERLPRERLLEALAAAGFRAEAADHPPHAYRVLAEV
ncbi:methyltransferase domain-containing protein [Hydrogenibacillus sp. N12]|uniref:class I SAM-dependent methyltransferase n=1 Tax=Hydrogenibacillus sp. N12 TaxID=2866627 RepID=UPI001C7D3829|nr:methyltransferase domain-containing protein [Hydrogenibacillus sp. N12]QZA32815.1 methyltransferase domain-containing protein [Hydrogenibacillus sp. N12]